MIPRSRTVTVLPLQIKLFKKIPPPTPLPLPQPGCQATLLGHPRHPTNSSSLFCDWERCPRVGEKDWRWTHSDKCGSPTHEWYTTPHSTGGYRADRHPCLALGSRVMDSMGHHNTLEDRAILQSSHRKHWTQKCG